MSYTFMSDGSFKIETLDAATLTGTWSAIDGQLFLTYSPSGAELTYDYTINGNQITLSYENFPGQTLTKK